MAGQRWEQVRALVARLDVGRLEIAAQDWDFFGSTLATVRDGMAGPRRELEATGLNALVRDPFFESVGRAETSFTTAAGELAPGGGRRTPAVVLRELAGEIDLVRREMDAAAAGGFLGAGAFPDQRSSTAAGGIIADHVRGEFDAQAEVFMNRLKGAFAAAGEQIGRSMSTVWPAGMPEVDPAVVPDGAPGSAAGPGRRVPGAPGAAGAGGGGIPAGGGGAGGAGAAPDAAGGAGLPDAAGAGGAGQGAGLGDGASALPADPVLAGGPAGSAADAAPAARLAGLPVGPAGGAAVLDPPGSAGPPGGLTDPSGSATAGANRSGLGTVPTPAALLPTPVRSGGIGGIPGVGAVPGGARPGTSGRPSGSGAAGAVDPTGVGRSGVPVGFGPVGRGGLGSGSGFEGGSGAGTGAGAGGMVRPGGVGTGVAAESARLPAVARGGVEAIAGSPAGAAGTPAGSAGGPGFYPPMMPPMMPGAGAAGGPGAPGRGGAGPGGGPVGRPSAERDTLRAGVRPELLGRSGESGRPGDAPGRRKARPAADVLDEELWEVPEPAPPPAAPPVSVPSTRSRRPPSTPLR